MNQSKIYGRFLVENLIVYLQKKQPKIVKLYQRYLFNIFLIFVTCLETKWRWGRREGEGLGGAGSEASILQPSHASRDPLYVYQ